MSFIDGLLVDLSQVLSNGLILSGPVLELAELLSLWNDLYNILQLDILVDSLDISCQGLDLDVIVATDDT